MQEENFSAESFQTFTQRLLGVSVNPVMDDRLHRFDVKKRGDKAGWYVYHYNDGNLQIAIGGCWQTGTEFRWSSKNKSDYTSTDWEAIRRADAERKKIQEDEWRKGAEKAKEIYLNSAVCPDGFSYLERKNVRNHDGLLHITETGDACIVPVYGADGEIRSIQKIFADPEKRKWFLPGARKKGGFCVIGTLGDKAYLCEGYATGASIYEATGTPVIVAFDGNNMKDVADELKSMLELTVVADNDLKEDGSNPGKSYAERTGLPYKLIPDAGMDANDYAAEHGLEALKNLLMPQTSSWIEDGDELLKTPSPLRWLIKGWIPREGLAMVFGASNSGKTFVVLDMLLSMSTGRGSWMGMKARNANCLYLCGEGFAGLRGRVALWAQEHGLSSVGTFKISKGPKRLNEASDLAFVAEQIDLSGMQPDIIAIDTLNRFFSGDENSAEEISGFLESLMELQNKYKCAILLIHHTGVSKEADMRARGSSALNAAADVAICVTNEKGYLTLTQTKQKDAELQEPVEVHLKGAVINGWIDEDGEEVRSAIIEPVGEEGKQVDVTEEMMIISDAWLRSEHKMMLGYPALSSSDLRTYMRDVLEWSRNKIKKVFANDYGSRFLRKMLSAGVIQMVEEQILMVDEVSVSCCLLTLSGMEKQGGANGANVVPKTFWHQ